MRASPISAETARLIEHASAAAVDAERFSGESGLAYIRMRDAVTLARMAITSHLKEA